MTVNATYSSKTEALTRANSFDALLNICERVWGGRREKGGQTKGMVQRKEGRRRYGEVKTGAGRGNLNEKRMLT